MDTDENSEGKLLDLSRATPAWRKLQIVESLTATARQLALSGLRKQNPLASEPQLRMKLASLILGSEDAKRIRECAVPAEGAMEKDQVETLLKVIAVLDSLSIPYVLGGSMASSVHGLPRTTNDADLIVLLHEGRVRDFASALDREFDADEQSIRRAVMARRSFNLISEKSMFKIDIFVGREGSFEAAQIERGRKETVAPGATASVATPEDVILAKLRWYRLGNEVSQRQWQDVREVARTQEGKLDLEYMNRWAKELRVDDLLLRILTGE